MNKAITDGLQLTPPAFADGLTVWARDDGTVGSATYDSDPDAAFVPADADFAGCLEVLKTDAVQKLRYMGQTPVLPGCYLRVTARVNAISGNLPSVRIAAWAGGAGDVHVSGLARRSPLTAKSWRCPRSWGREIGTASTCSGRRRWSTPMSAST